MGFFRLLSTDAVSAGRISGSISVQHGDFILPLGGSATLPESCIQEVSCRRDLGGVGTCTPSCRRLGNWAFLCKPVGPFSLQMPLANCLQIMKLRNILSLRCLDEIAWGVDSCTRQEADALSARLEPSSARSSQDFAAQREGPLPLRRQGRSRLQGFGLKPAKTAAGGLCFGHSKSIGVTVSARTNPKLQQPEAYEHIL